MARSVPGSSQVGEEVASGGGGRLQLTVQIHRRAAACATNLFLISFLTAYEF
jgi:hypothetical protein